LSIVAKFVAVSECEKNEEIVSRTIITTIARLLLLCIVFVAKFIIMLHAEIQLSIKSFTLRFFKMKI